MPDPLAYFLTWPTYGTWLPGDERGWVWYRHGYQHPDPMRKLEAEALMTEDACILDPQQRELVEKTVQDHCDIRGWELHAVNCRTNHLHIVVSANLHPDKVRAQFKAWCTRRLKELEESRRRHAAMLADWAIRSGEADMRVVEEAIRENWWAERGSGRFLNDQISLDAATLYVRDGQ